MQTGLCYAFKFDGKGSRSNGGQESAIRSLQPAVGKTGTEDDDMSGNAIIRRGSAADTPALTAIWRRSVEATHAFLSRDDIDDLRPQVEAALGLLDVWVAEAAGGPAGFMAMDGNMIEALFIDPPSMGMRLGTMFIDHAKTVCADGAELRVDVNEANPAALGFYLSRGFRRIGRSETDRAGRPWPLLHLAMAVPMPADGAISGADR